MPFSEVCVLVSWATRDEISTRRNLIAAANPLQPIGALNITVDLGI
ncbi:MAG TPA: hypothetical protein VED86_06900 [archaeon]|nr:hypothetical protein [archaeon]